MALQKEDAPRWYRVVALHRQGEADAGFKTERHKVAAYDVSDAAEQIRIEHPGAIVQSVGPSRAPGPGKEWGGRQEVAAMLGVTPGTAAGYLAELEANYMLTHIGEGSGRRWNLRDVSKLLVEMARDRD